ncbi:hypothetical protein WA158_002287 [Blastocystis sp. Blastoise]
MLEYVIERAEDIKNVHKTNLLKEEQIRYSTNKIFGNSVTVSLHTQAGQLASQLYIAEHLKSYVKDPIFRFTSFSFDPLGRTEIDPETGLGKCLNGRNECRVELYQYCCVKMMGPRSSVEFLKCIQLHSEELDLWGYQCSVDGRVDWRVIKKCAKEEGDVFKEMVVQRYRAYPDPIAQFPTIVVDGKICPGECPNLKDVICESFKGDVIPPPCLAPVATEKKVVTTPPPVKRHFVGSVPLPYKIYVTVFTDFISISNIFVWTYLSLHLLQTQSIDTWYVVHIVPMLPASIKLNEGNQLCDMEDEKCIKYIYGMCALDMIYSQKKQVKALKCLFYVKITDDMAIRNCFEPQFPINHFYECTGTSKGRKVLEHYDAFTSLFVNNKMSAPVVIIGNYTCESRCTGIDKEVKNRVSYYKRLYEMEIEPKDEEKRLSLNYNVIPIDKYDIIKNHYMYFKYTPPTTRNVYSTRMPYTEEELTGKPQETAPVAATPISDEKKQQIALSSIEHRAVELIIAEKKKQKIVNIEEEFEKIMKKKENEVIDNEDGTTTRIDSQVLDTGEQEDVSEEERKAALLKAMGIKQKPLKQKKALTIDDMAKLFNSTDTNNNAKSNSNDNISSTTSSTGTSSSSSSSPNFIKENNKEKENATTNNIKKEKENEAINNIKKEKEASTINDINKGKEIIINKEKEIINNKEKEEPKTHLRQQNPKDTKKTTSNDDEDDEDDDQFMKLTKDTTTKDTSEKMNKSSLTNILSLDNDDEDDKKSDATTKKTNISKDTIQDSTTLNKSVQSDNSRTETQLNTSNDSTENTKKQEQDGKLMSLLNLSDEEDDEKSDKKSSTVSSESQSASTIQTTTENNKENSNKENNNKENNNNENNKENNNKETNNKENNNNIVEEQESISTPQDIMSEKTNTETVDVQEIKTIIPKKDDDDDDNDDNDEEEKKKKIIINDENPTTQIDKKKDDNDNDDNDDEEKEEKKKKIIINDENSSTTSLSSDNNNNDITSSTTTVDKNKEEDEKAEEEEEEDNNNNKKDSSWIENILNNKDNNIHVNPLERIKEIIDMYGLNDTALNTLQTDTIATQEDLPKWTYNSSDALTFIKQRSLNKMISNDNNKGYISYSNIQKIFSSLLPLQYISPIIFNTNDYIMNIIKNTPIPSISPIPINIIFDLDTIIEPSFINSITTLLESDIYQLLTIHYLPLQNLYINFDSEVDQVIDTSTKKMIRSVSRYICSLDMIQNPLKEWYFTVCLLTKSNRKLDSFIQCLNDLQIDAININDCVKSSETKDKFIESIKLRNSLVLSNYNTTSFMDSSLPLVAIHQSIYTLENTTISSIICKYIPKNTYDYCSIKRIIRDQGRDISLDETYNPDYYIKDQISINKDTPRVDIFVDFDCRNSAKLLAGIMNSLLVLKDIQYYLLLYIHPINKGQLHYLTTLDDDTHIDPPMADSICTGTKMESCYTTLLYTCTNLIYPDIFRYWRFYRCIASYYKYTFAYLETCAFASNIDIQSIYTCLQSERPIKQLQKDLIALAHSKLRISSFPTVFVNNRKVRGLSKVLSTICEQYELKPDWCDTIKPLVHVSVCT